MSLREFMQSRRRIRDRLIADGRPAYPQAVERNYSNAEAQSAQDGVSMTVGGRIRAIRAQGKITFIDIVDESGKMQLVFRIGETVDIELLSDFDLGDFIQASGYRFTTRAGEPSVRVITFKMLCKALRPIPDTHYGLSNREERYRRRYLDLLINPEVREVFRKRSAIIRSVRQTLDAQGFLEVETPTLQPLYGGANARPFTTNINAFDGMEMYLKISDELYLKRLIIGGIDRVYEIDKDFRNEGVSYRHNPEFTMMECYAAYWDYHDMMRLTEEIYRHAALAATGSTVVNYTLIDRSNPAEKLVPATVQLNFQDPWPRVTMKEAIAMYLGIEVDALSDEQLRQTAANLAGDQRSDVSVSLHLPLSRGLLIAEIFAHTEHHFVQPTFIMDFPRETTALCKPHRHDRNLIERFEPYIAGMEVGNAYTELNDPILQRQFMESERGDEAHPLDEDFIEALEYGMPPTGGLGLGIDRMVMILTNCSSIKDVLLFPIMKPRYE